MSKQIKCPECKGKGEIPCPIDYDEHPHPANCPGCAGDRHVRVECPRCDGTGKIDAN